MKKKTQVMPRITLTHQQVVDLVMTLHPALIGVYDFMLFVMSHLLMPAAVADIFGETAEEMRTAEAEWDQQFETSRENLRAIAHEAAEEFRAGRTKPMEFSPEGRLVR